ncbi:AEC family transporter [Luedemannella flava]
MTFSNMVQLGIPVVTALFGTAGLTLHIALISLHAVILLTTATVLAEISRNDGRSLIGQTVRRSLIHPVTLPILLGLAYHATGLPIPGVIDDVLAGLGVAVVPLSLVTIGLSLQQYGLRGSGRTAAGLALTKLVVHPLLVLTTAWLVGLRGLPLTIAVLCAALPTGANVLLFAGRYRSHQGEATATIVFATFAYAVTVTAWLFVVT